MICGSSIELGNGTLDALDLLGVSTFGTTSPSNAPWERHARSSAVHELAGALTRSQIEPW